MRILVFAPHNDDEVLGVGGTIAKYVNEGHEVYVCEVTSGVDKKRLERIENEALAAHRILGVKETMFLGLPVVGLSDIPLKELNQSILDAVNKVKPDIAYIPHKGDMHDDHTRVAESAMVALRPVNSPQLKAIYAYETLSETEWNIPTVDNAFIPNAWTDISETIDDKLRAMSEFKSQVKEFPNPRSLEAIESLSKFRGSTICVRNAESFMVVRIIN
ncbi:MULTISPECIES: PIG-L deacetylase family protein [Bacillaceae]|uniref:N-acetylglucosaminylphosphatidylinositol deacetylase n=1 Tax=Alkalicoccobacillus plakortidis TaxID=444060 RepID=A0A9D5DSX4_9BACI|nr:MULTISPECIES: PIG-L deacetylase family protein [Bacillaceae]KQL56491.1 N-acetylglucosaminylphosphatidylinositol deacetylase [Alkalicoccobacillus plakortidis]